MVDVNSRRRLCTIVAAAFIDGRFENAEKGVVYRKGRELGFTAQQIDEIVELGRKGALAVSVPPTQKQKEELLDDLIDVACADQKLEPAENHLLMKFAGQIGLSVTDVGERVRRKMGQGRKPPPAVSGEAVLIIEEPKVTRPVPAPRRKTEDLLVAAPTMEFSKPTPGPLDRMATVSRPPDLKGGGDSESLHRLAGELKPLPPGPIQLAGPSILSSSENSHLGFIALELVKQRIMVEGIEGAVVYMKDFCGVEDPVKARSVIDDLLRENPGMKPGAGHANLV